MKTSTSSSLSVNGTGSTGSANLHGNAISLYDRCNLQRIKREEYLAEERRKKDEKAMSDEKNVCTFKPRISSPPSLRQATEEDSMFVDIGGSAPPATVPSSSSQQQRRSLLSRTPHLNSVTAAGGGSTPTSYLSPTESSLKKGNDRLSLNRTSRGARDKANSNITPAKSSSLSLSSTHQQQLQQEPEQGNEDQMFDETLNFVDASPMDTEQTPSNVSSNHDNNYNSSVYERLNSSLTASLARSRELQRWGRRMSNEFSWRSTIYDNNNYSYFNQTAKSQHTPPIAISLYKNAFERKENMNQSMVEVQKEEKMLHVSFAKSISSESRKIAKTHWVKKIRDTCMKFVDMRNNMQDYEVYISYTQLKMIFKDLGWITRVSDDGPLNATFNSPGTYSKQAPFLTMAKKTDKSFHANVTGRRLSGNRNDTSEISRKTRDDWLFNESLKILDPQALGYTTLEELLIRTENALDSHGSGDPDSSKLPPTDRPTRMRSHNHPRPPINIMELVNSAHAETKEKETKNIETEQQSENLNENAFQDIAEEQKPKEFFDNDDSAIFKDVEETDNSVILAPAPQSIKNETVSSNQIDEASTEIPERQEAVTPNSGISSSNTPVLSDSDSLVQMNSVRQRAKFFEMQTNKHLETQQKYSPLNRSARSITSESKEGKNDLFKSPSRLASHVSTSSSQSDTPSEVKLDDNAAKDKEISQLWAADTSTSVILPDTEKESLMNEPTLEQSKFEDTVVLEDNTQNHKSQLSDDDSNNKNDYDGNDLLLKENPKDEDLTTHNFEQNEFVDTEDNTALFTDIMPEGSAQDHHAVFIFHELILNHLVSNKKQNISNETKKQNESISKKIKSPAKGEKRIYDRLLDLGKDAAEKKIIAQAKKDAVALKDCSFQPSINEKSKIILSSKEQNQNHPVYEKLYKEANMLRDKADAKLFQSYIESEQEEMKECSFVPKITKYENHRSKDRYMGPDTIPDVMKHVERYQIARDKRTELQERYENIGRPPTDEEYRNNRSLLEEHGPIPFTFGSTVKSRRRESVISNQQQEPDLVMKIEIDDVNSGMIHIYRGDLPRQLAHRFATQHSISTEMEENLESHIRQAMKEKKLLDEWALFWDESRKRWFFFNSTTKESSWECPPGVDIEQVPYVVND